MAFVGVSLRNTSGYVTDPSGVMYCLGEVYPTKRGGLTFGWASSLVANSRNRNASIDARLAGCNFVVNSGATNTFTLDLPNGPGTYRVRLAIGDYGSAQNNLVLVKDGSTTLATINVATSANRFTDAASTGSGVGGLTNTGWVSGNVDVELTFSGSTIALVCGGHSSGSLSSALAHLAVEFVGGGDTTPPVLSSPTGTATGSTTATVGATTDEGNGTMYAFVSTSATPPSATDLKAGTGATWSGSQAISSTGAKTFSATGLTASTGYYAHLIHTDAAANDSNIVTSAQFTTSAPAENPVITSQPSNQTVKRGQTATFTTAATGSGTVTYQWQRNPGGAGSWADISGATSASYTTPATTISGGSANDQDDYRCNVSDDDAGPVATDVVTLTVQQCVLALNSAGYEFGDGNDIDTLAVLASTELQVAAYPLTEWPPVSAIATATATTGTNGRLADLGDDDLVFGTTYRVIARNAADGETWAWMMAAS